MSRSHKTLESRSTGRPSDNKSKVAQLLWREHSSVLGVLRQRLMATRLRRTEGMLFEREVRINEP